LAILVILVIIAGIAIVTGLDLAFKRFIMRGKDIRLERIMNRDSGTTVIVPMDHGVTVGPIAGLTDLEHSVNLVAEGGANAVLGHMGLALHGYRKGGSDIGLILHLSASTSRGPDPNDKVIVNTVTNALKMGADGVSVHINIGADNEARMLKDLGMVAVECMEWGMPLLAMMYPRGRKIVDETSAEAVCHAARVASEPTLRMIEGAMEAGAAGVSIGRNAFQHVTPDKFIYATAMIVHEGRTADEAIEVLKV